MTIYSLIRLIVNGFNLITARMRTYIFFDTARKVGKYQVMYVFGEFCKELQIEMSEDEKFGLGLEKYIPSKNED